MKYIPDIRLVGYGRTQNFQVECLACKKLFFHNGDGKLKDLFCEDCENKKNLESYIKESNKSEVLFLGNIVGWEMRIEDQKSKRTRYNYKKVYKRDEYQCQYCGYSPYKCVEFRPLHIDHIKPWCVGGSNSMDNLVVACSICNQLVGSKWFESFYEKRLYIVDSLIKKEVKIYARE